LRILLAGHVLAGQQAAVEEVNRADAAAGDRLVDGHGVGHQVTLV
jgi:hypothetical protein